MADQKIDYDSIAQFGGTVVDSIPQQKQAPREIDYGSVSKFGGSIIDKMPPAAPAQQSIDYDLSKYGGSVMDAPASVPGMEKLGGVPPGPRRAPIPFGLSRVEMTDAERAALPFIERKPVEDVRPFMRDTDIGSSTEVPPSGRHPVTEGIGRMGTGAKKILTAGPTPRQPGNLRQMASGATDIIEGGFEAASPLVPMAAVEAPLGTLLTLAAATAASKGVDSGLRAAGVPAEYAGLGGAVAAALVGGTVGRKALEVMWRAAGSPEVKIGKFDTPKEFSDMTDEELVAHANSIEKDPPKNYNWQKEQIVQEVAKRQAERGVGGAPAAGSTSTEVVPAPQGGEGPSAEAPKPVTPKPPAAVTVEVGHTYETPTGTHAVTAVDARTGVVTYDKTLPDGSVISNIRTPMERFRRMVARPTPRPAAQPAPAAAGAPTQAPAAAPVATPEDILAQAPVAPQGSQPVPPLSSEQSTIPPSSPSEVVSPPAVGLPVVQEPNATTVAPSAVPAPPAPVSAPGVAPSPDGVNAPAPAPGPAPVAPPPGADVQGAPAVSGVEPSPNSNESLQERSWREAAENFNRVSANPEAANDKDLRRAINYLSHARERFTRGHWDAGTTPDANVLAGYNNEVDYYGSILQRREASSRPSVLATKPEISLAPQQPPTVVGEEPITPGTEAPKASTPVEKPATQVETAKPSDNISPESKTATGAKSATVDVPAPKVERGDIKRVEKNGNLDISVDYRDPKTGDYLGAAMNHPSMFWKTDKRPYISVVVANGKQNRRDELEEAMGADFEKHIEEKEPANLQQLKDLVGAHSETAAPKPETKPAEPEKPATEPVTPESRALANKGVAKAVDDLIDASDRASRSTKSGSAMAEIEAERLRQFIRNGKEYADSPLAKSADPKQVAMLGRTIELAEKVLDGLKAAAKPEVDTAAAKPEAAPSDKPQDFVQDGTVGELHRVSGAPTEEIQERAQRLVERGQARRLGVHVKIVPHPAAPGQIDMDAAHFAVEVTRDGERSILNDSPIKIENARRGALRQLFPKPEPAKSVEDKAAEMWAAMDENQRAGVRHGMFPAEVMRAAEAEGYPGKDLSVALMDQAEKPVTEIRDGDVVVFGGPASSERGNVTARNADGTYEVRIPGGSPGVRGAKPARNVKVQPSDIRKVNGQPYSIPEKAPRPSAPGATTAASGTVKAGDRVRWKDYNGQVATGKVAKFLPGAEDPGHGRRLEVLRDTPTDSGQHAYINEDEVIGGRTVAQQSQTPEEVKQSGVNALVDAVQQTIESGGSLGKVDSLTKLAEKHLGSSRTSGNWTPKDMFDAMEAGINKHLIETGADLMSKPFEQAMQDLRNLMARVTTQGVRTDEQVKLQQFSTPPTESFVAAKAAGIRPSDVVLEPSAGNGGLAVWPKSIGAEVHVNEISERRQEMLKAAGFDNITAHDGEILNAMLDRSVQPTVILMNPPFSAGGAKSGPAKNDNQYGFNHVNAALQRLAPGGRLVAILGGGRADDMNGGATLLGGPSGKWFTDLAQRYNVRANVRIHGREYQKYGTNFATRIIVIDKTGPTPSRVTNAPNWESVVRGNADTLEDAYKLLEGVADDRPQIAIGAPGARGVGAGNAGNPEGRTGDVSGRSDGGVLPGSGRTPETGAMGGESGSGRPAGGSAGARPGGAGKPTDLRQPETERPEPAETAPARTPASGVENADFQRPIPGADDLAASAGMTAQDIIAAAKQALGEKMGKSPAPPPPQIPAPTPAKPRAPRKAVAKKPPAEKPKESGNALSGAADKAMQDLEQWMKAQGGGDNEGPSSIQARAADPKPNQPVPPQVLINLATIGGEQMLDGATSFPKWAEAMTAKAGPIISFVAERGNSSPDTVLRQIYQLSSEVAKDFGATAEPLPPAVDQAEQKALADQSGKLEIERDTTPKSEQEDSAAYVTYRPTLKGPAHPGDIVETKTMSTVPLPEITYRPNLPKSVLEDGRLSAVQLEAIAIAGQQNEIILPGGYRASALIGDGCVAAGTRIYNPVSGQHTPIEDLVKRGRPHVVMALTPEGFRAHMAECPFLKGTADLYRVALEDGREITVTDEHKFLTPDGWKTILGGLVAGEILASAEVGQSSGLADGRYALLKSAASCYQTPEDCLDRYWPYPHTPGGERLHSGAGSARVPSPSPAGVRARSRDYPRTDGRSPSREHSHQHPGSGHLSKSDFSPAGFPCRVSTSAPSGEAFAQLPAATRGGARQFPAETDPRRQQGGAVHQDQCALLDCGTDQRGAVAPQWKDSVTASFSCGHYSRWNRITAIEFIRRDSFYDMYVPGPENYVAEGFVNHNTGVGKGRIAAGIMMDNYRQGRKRLVFVTEKWDLMQDIIRDLHGIGAHDLLRNVDRNKAGQWVTNSQSAVRPFNKWQAGTKVQHDGILFSTYALIRSENNKGETRAAQLEQYLRGEDDGEGSVIVFDECLPAGTMIETPNGAQPIESLRDGDEVLGFNHETGQIEATKVQHCFQRQTADPLLSVNGVPMTGNHPVWTENRGYVRADEISALDRVAKIEAQSTCDELRVVRNAVETSVLQSELLGEAHACGAVERQAAIGPRLRVVQAAVHAEEKDNAQRTGRQGAAVLHEAVFSVLEDEQPGIEIQAHHYRPRQREVASGYGVMAESPARPGETGAASVAGKQPARQTGYAIQVSDDAQGEWFSGDAGRQRESAASARETSRGASGVADGGGGSGRTLGQDGKPQPEILQDRHCGTTAEDRNRSGRLEPQPAEGEGIRQAEGSVFGGKRVDVAPLQEPPSVDGFQQCGGGDRKREVFNIETGTGNYFANSLLIHNCHALKNAQVGQGGQASQIGVAVKNLLASLPKLRTTSLSATAATDVMNLGYLDRLGLWGPGTAFPTGFQEFASQIAGGKLAAMEMVARELKAQGKYLSRTLSFKGVTYDEAEHQITPEQADLYRTATNAWRRVVNEAETSIETTTNGGSRQTSRFLSQLGAAQQRFFNLLITALKTPTAVELAQKALADGKSVVITLVNTNEAAQNREKARAASEGDEDEPPDFDFGPKQMLLDLVREHYPVQQYADDVDDNGNAIKVPVTRPDPKTGKPIAVNNPEAEAKRDALLADIDRDLHMPENPLDILINSLGGSGKVAELTGRKERFDSSVGKFVPRGDPNAARKDVNLFEMRAFQEGKKRIAVLSTAAGTGISLHAGNDVANQQKRYHMTLQVGWSADKAMQMFGRTHRTNQVHPPEYVMLVSDLGGEKRFVSTIARRLGSLGAITKGQKDATSGTDLMDKVNFETEQGKQATQAFYESLLRDQPVPGAIKMEKGDDGVWKQAPGVMTGKEVLSDLRMLSGDPPTVPLKHRQNVTRLLNRLLALDPESQNGAYNYFYDIFQAVVQRAIEQNTLDTGVKTLPGDTISVKEQRPIGKDPKTGAETFYYQVDANVKNKRMSQRDLERRMAADPTAQILRNDKGKLALATDAKPIVHASGSLEQAYYISTPGKGNPVKTGIDSIRNRVKPVEQWAKEESEAAKREMQSAQRELEWSQSSYDRSKRYFESGLNDRIQQNEQRAKYTQSAFERDRAQASLTTARQQLAAFQETGELPEDNYERKNLDSARAKVENLKIRVATAEEALVDPLEWAKQEWQRQYDDAPSHTTNPHHLIGGAVMRYWNAVREASQLSNIYTATDSKSGKRVVGVDVPAERIGQLLARITGGASTVNATQLRTDVLRNNLTYQLEGGIQVRRGMIARQPIVQLIPANQEQAANLRSLGVLYERGVMPVHYIPNGGEFRSSPLEILTRVLEQYPVQQDDNGGPGGEGPAPLQSRRAPEAGDTYRRAGKSVDGLTVRSEVPNTDSIAASLNDYEVLPGIREVPISAFETPNSYYAADDQRRVRALADQIKESGEISPLIVVVDGDPGGPYVLEGGHRLAALHLLGKTSLPAMVVLDAEALSGPEALQSRRPTPPEVEDAVSSLPESLRKHVDVRRVVRGDFGTEYEGTGGRYEPRDKTIYIERGETDPNIVRHEALHSVTRNLNGDTPLLKDYVEARYAPEAARQFSARLDEIPGFGYSYDGEEEFTKDLQRFVESPEKLKPAVRAVFDKHFGEPTAPGQPPLLQEAPMPTGDFPSLKEIEAYWGAAEAQPDTVEGQPVVWVNGAAMDAILARMGPSGEGGDSSDTLGLLLAPSEWLNVLDEARVAARNPRPGGFDDAVARVGRQIEQALKLNEPGASRVKPLVVVQAGDSIKPEAIQKILHEELDHAQQMQLPTGVKGLPVEMLDSAAGKKAVAALLKQGYRMAAKDSQYYEQNRAVMAAEVGARLMRGGRYQDLGLTPEEAVDLAAQYIEGLERMHGAKAESIVERTRDAIKQNQASLGRRSTDLDRQHETGDSGAPQGRPQGADQLPAEPEPAEPASGAQPLAGRASEFLKDESGASSVAKAIRDRINKKMASSGEDRARRMLSVGSRKNALEALRESLKEDADSKIGEKIRTYVTGERDIRIAETNQMRDVYQDFIPSHVDQEALTLMRDFKNRPGELEAFLDGTHPYYDELKMTPEERTAAMERIGELGPVIARALNPTPEMLGADQDLTDYFTRHLEEGRKLGFLDSTISNEEYITHLLNPLDQEEEQAPAKKQSKIGQLLRGKLGPRKFRFSQQRHFPTVLHYIAAGGRPKSINALNALAVYGEKYATTAAYHLLIRALRTSKAGKWGTYSDQKRGDIPANWVEMAPESRIFRLDTPYNDDNGNARVSHRMLFVPPVVRDAMRPILDPNYMNLVPGFQKSRLYQAYIKTVELGLSIFHLRALNITALGNENLDGMVESYVADMKSPEFHEAEQSWIRAGLVTPVLGRTVEVYRALQPSSLPTTKEKILSIPGLKQVDQLASAISHLTFGIVQRKFKVTDASLKYAAWIEKNPKATPQEAFEAQRLIAKQVNATYGGLHWENMGVHRMSLEISKLALLAPDWTFSNIANVKYAFEGGPQGSAARLFWLRSALFGLALTAAASLLLSGKLSKDPTQVNLGKDKEGHELHDNMFFVGAPGDMLTLIRNANHYGAIVGTAITIGGKFGPIPRTGMHLMANQDAQRRQIIPKTVKTDLLGRPTKAHEPGALEKTAIGAKEAAREVAPVPFSVSTIVKMLMDRTHHYTAAQYAATAISGRMPQADHAPARHR